MNKANSFLISMVIGVLSVSSGIAQKTPREWFPKEFLKVEKYKPKMSDLGKHISNWKRLEKLTDEEVVLTKLRIFGFPDQKIKPVDFEITDKKTLNAIQSSMIPGNIMRFGMGEFGLVDGATGFGAHLGAMRLEFKDGDSMIVGVSKDCFFLDAIHGTDRQCFFSYGMAKHLDVLLKKQGFKDRLSKQDLGALSGETLLANIKKDYEKWRLDSKVSKKAKQQSRDRSK